MQQFFSNSLANKNVFRNFAEARVSNTLTKCQLKTQYFKVMPGLSFGLGTLAGSYTRLRRAVLCLFPSVYQILRDMLPNYSDLNRQMLRCIAKSELCLLASKTGVRVLIPYFEPVKRPTGLRVAFPLNFQVKEVANG